MNAFTYILIVLGCSPATRAAVLGPVKFFDTSNITEEVFSSLLLSGDVAVIKGASSFWPLTNWTCGDFRSNPGMKNFKVERVYGANDGTFVPLCETCESWEQDERRSLNDDKNGPQFAPLYWDVKADPASIDLIDSLTPAWPFLSTANQYWKRKAVEVWFSPPAAGAKYHIDGHIQATAVSQLVGRRRWRLQLIPDERSSPSVLPGHLDSNVFAWTPDIEIILDSGDLLVFPPGTVHDTLNIGDSCAVSVTHQLGVPLPVAFYRRHMGRILSLGDAREIWPAIADLASFGFLRPKTTTSVPYFEPHENLTAVAPGMEYNEADPAPFFRSIYRQFFDSAPKLPGHFGYRRIEEYIAFHDVDGDGVVTESEFVQTGVEWLGIEDGIMETIPAKFRPARYFYQKLEDLVNEGYWAALRVDDQRRRDAWIATQAKVDQTRITPIDTADNCTNNATRDEL